MRLLILILLFSYAKGELFDYDEWCPENYYYWRSTYHQYYKTMYHPWCKVEEGTDFFGAVVDAFDYENCELESYEVPYRVEERECFPCTANTPKEIHLLDTYPDPSSSFYPGPLPDYSGWVGITPKVREGSCFYTDESNKKRHLNTRDVQCHIKQCGPYEYGTLKQVARDKWAKAHIGLGMYECSRERDIASIVYTNCRTCPEGSYLPVETWSIPDYITYAYNKAAYDNPCEPWIKCGKQADMTSRGPFDGDHKSPGTCEPCTFGEAIDDQSNCLICGNQVDGTPRGLHPSGVSCGECTGDSFSIGDHLDCISWNQETIPDITEMCSDTYRVMVEAADVQPTDQFYVDRLRHYQECTNCGNTLSNEWDLVQSQCSKACLSAGYQFMFTENNYQYSSEYTLYKQKCYCLTIDLRGLSNPAECQNNGYEWLNLSYPIHPDYPDKKRHVLRPLLDLNLPYIKCDAISDPDAITESPAPSGSPVCENKNFVKISKALCDTKCSRVGQYFFHDGETCLCEGGVSNMPSFIETPYLKIYKIIDTDLYNDRIDEYINRGVCEQIAREINVPFSEVVDGRPEGCSADVRGEDVIRLVYSNASGTSSCLTANDDAFCSDDSLTDQSTCVQSKHTWTVGTCTNGVSTDQSTCEGTKYVWTPSHCTDGSSTDKSECEAIKYKWTPGTCTFDTNSNKLYCEDIGEIFTPAACSDGVSTDQSTCEATKHTWTPEHCSDGIAVDPQVCEATKHTWYTDSCSIDSAADEDQCEGISAIWTPDTCSDGVSTDKDICESSAHVWTPGSCSTDIITDQTTCELEKHIWTVGPPGSCSDGTSLNRDDCENAPVNTWTPGSCSWTNIKDRHTCIINSGTWTPGTCSATIEDENTCETARHTWDPPFCSKVTITDQSTCESSSETWTPDTCSDGVSTDQSTCESLQVNTWTPAWCSLSGVDQAACEQHSELTWHPATCSDGVSTDQATCESPRHVWTPAFCSDDTITDQSTCETKYTWTTYSCSDGVSTDQSTCESAQANTWTPAFCSDGVSTDQSTCESLFHLWTPAFCSVDTMSDETTCEGNSGVWTSAYCSNSISSDQSTCESTPVNTWIPDSCSDGVSIYQSTCEATPINTWTESSCSLNTASSALVCSKFGGTYSEGSCPDGIGTTRDICEVTPVNVWITASCSDNNSTDKDICETTSVDTWTRGTCSDGVSIDQNTCVTTRTNTWFSNTDAVCLTSILPSISCVVDGYTRYRTSRTCVNQARRCESELSQYLSGDTCYPCQDNTKINGYYRTDHTANNLAENDSYGKMMAVSTMNEKYLVNSHDECAARCRDHKGFAYGNSKIHRLETLLKDNSQSHSDLSLKQCKRFHVKNDRLYPEFKEIRNATFPKGCFIVHNQTDPSSPSHVWYNHDSSDGNTGMCGNTQDVTLQNYKQTSHEWQVMDKWSECDVDNGFTFACSDSMGCYPDERRTSYNPWAGTTSQCTINRYWNGCEHDWTFRQRADSYGDASGHCMSDYTFCTLIGEQEIVISHTILGTAYTGTYYFRYDTTQAKHDECYALYGTDTHSSVTTECIRDHSQDFDYNCQCVPEIDETGYGSATGFLLNDPSSSSWIPGSCSDGVSTDKGTCESKNKYTFTPGSCSDGITSEKHNCEMAKHVYIPDACSDTISTNQNTCESEKYIWYPEVCSDENSTDKATCENKQVATWIPGICSDGVSTDNVTCLATNHTWTNSSCSDSISTDQFTCEATKHTWTPDSCSDGVSNNQSSCLSTPLYTWSTTPVCSDGVSTDNATCLSTPLYTWTPDSCSDGVSNTQSSCLSTPLYTWTPGSCSDLSSTNQSSCLSTPLYTWTPATCTTPASCSDGISTDQSSCLSTPLYTWTPGSCSDGYNTNETSCLSTPLYTWTPGTCSDLNSTNKTTCELTPKNTWLLGSCSDNVSTDNATCESIPLYTWTPGSCSDGNSTDNATCESTPLYTWTPGVCSDGVSTDPNVCESLPHSWTPGRCSSTEIRNKFQCEAAKHRWIEGVWLMADHCTDFLADNKEDCENTPANTWTNGTCFDDRYTDRESCIINLGGWSPGFCSTSHTPFDRDQTICESAKHEWTPGYCSDGKSNDQSTCESTSVYRWTPKQCTDGTIYDDFTGWRLGRNGYCDDYTGKIHFGSTLEECKAFCSGYKGFRFNDNSCSCFSKYSFQCTNFLSRLDGVFYDYIDDTYNKHGCENTPIYSWTDKSCSDGVTTDKYYCELHKHVWTPGHCPDGDIELSSNCIVENTDYYEYDRSCKIKTYPCEPGYRASQPSPASVHNNLCTQCERGSWNDDGLQNCFESPIDCPAGREIRYIDDSAPYTAPNICDPCPIDFQQDIFYFQPNAGSTDKCVEKKRCGPGEEPQRLADSTIDTICVSCAEKHFNNKTDYSSCQPVSVDKESCNFKNSRFVDGGLVEDNYCIPCGENEFAHGAFCYKKVDHYHDDYLEFIDETYSVCEGENATLLFNHYSNVQEVTEVGYTTYDSTQNIGDPILGFHYKYSSIELDSLGAAVNETRYFVNTLNPSKKFRTNCVRSLQNRKLKYDIYDAASQCNEIGRKYNVLSHACERCEAHHTAINDTCFTDRIRVSGDFTKIPDISVACSEGQITIGDKCYEENSIIIDGVSVPRYIKYESLTKHVQECNKIWDRFTASWVYSRFSFDTMQCAGECPINERGLGSRCFSSNVLQEAQLRETFCANKGKSVDNYEGIWAGFQYEHRLDESVVCGQMCNHREFSFGGICVRKNMFKFEGEWIDDIMFKHNFDLPNMDSYSKSTGSWKNMNWYGFFDFQYGGFSVDVPIEDVITICNAQHKRFDPTSKKCVPCSSDEFAFGVECKRIDPRPCINCHMDTDCTVCLNDLSCSSCRNNGCEYDYYRKVRVGENCYDVRRRIIEEPPSWNREMVNEKPFTVTDFNFVTPTNLAMSAGGAKPYGFRVLLNSTQNLTIDNPITIQMTKTSGLYPMPFKNDFTIGNLDDGQDIETVVGEEGCYIMQNESSTSLRIQSVMYSKAIEAISIWLHGDIIPDESIMIVCHLPSKTSKLPNNEDLVAFFKYGLQLLDEFNGPYELYFRPETCKKEDSFLGLYGYDMISESSWESTDLQLSAKCATGIGYHGATSWDGSSDKIEIYSCPGTLNEKLYDYSWWRNFYKEDPIFAEYFEVFQTGTDPQEDPSVSYNLFRDFGDRYKDPFRGVTAVGCKMGFAKPPVNHLGYDISKCNHLMSGFGECCGCPDYINNRFDLVRYIDQNQYPMGLGYCGDAEYSYKGEMDKKSCDKACQNYDYFFHGIDNSLNKCYCITGGNKLPRECSNWVFAHRSSSQYITYQTSSKLRRGIIKDTCDSEFTTDFYSCGQQNHNAPKTWDITDNYEAFSELDDVCNPEVICADYDGFTDDNTVDLPCIDDDKWFDDNFGDSFQNGWNNDWSTRSKMRRVDLQFTEEKFNPDDPFVWGEYTLRGCRPETCIHPTDPKYIYHGELWVGGLERRNFGVQVRCAPGYIESAAGLQVTRCPSDGTSYMVTGCRPLICVPPRFNVTGYVLSNETASLDSQPSGSCAEGYSGIFVAKLCTEEGGEYIPTGCVTEEFCNKRRQPFLSTGCGDLCPETQYAYGDQCYDLITTCSDPDHIPLGGSNSSQHTCKPVSCGMCGITHWKCVAPSDGLNGINWLRSELEADTYTPRKDFNPIATCKANFIGEPIIEPCQTNEGFVQQSGCEEVVCIAPNTSGYIYNGGYLGTGTGQFAPNVSCAEEYHGNPVVTPCSSNGTEYTVSGCEVSVCASSTNPAYSVTETDLKMISFEVCSDGCTPLYKPTGDNITVTKCTEHGGEYVLEGCEPRLCAQPEGLNLVFDGNFGMDQFDVNITCADGYFTTENITAEPCTKEDQPFTVSGDCSPMVCIIPENYQLFGGSINVPTFAPELGCGPDYSGTPVSSPCAEHQTPFTASGCNPNTCVAATTSGYVYPEGPVSILDMPLNISCAEGYYGNGSIVGCPNEGASYLVEGCIPPSCVHPTDTRYTFDGNDLAIDNFAPIITCASDYHGTPVATKCSEHGQEYTVTGCEPNVCVSPSTTGYLFNGGVLDVENFAPNITCATDYHGTPIATKCSEDGQEYTVTGCEPNVCIPITATGYTHIEGDLNVLSFTPSIECAAGYHGTPVVVSCSQHNQEYTATGCEPNVCVHPSVTGYVTGSGNVSIDNFAPVITCSADYHGTPIATPCSEDGQEYTVTGCEPNVCIPTTTTGYTHIDGNLDVSSFTPNVECSPYYHGTPVATPCSEDGQEYTVTGCEANVCACDHGVASTDKCLIHEDQNCTSCNSGYWLNGVVCEPHSDCPPGQGTVNYDSELDTNTVCEQCTGDPKYNNENDKSPCGDHQGCSDNSTFYTYAPSGDLCTPCTDNSEAIGNFVTSCTCKDGYWKNSDICQLHDECNDNEHEISAPDAYNNRVCAINVCIAPSTTGYVFNGGVLDVENFAPDIVCGQYYYGTPVATKCSENGQEYTVTGCEPNICTEPSNEFGYVFAGGDLNAASFSPIISCQNGFHGPPVATPCEIDGEPYTYTGCEPSDCAYPTTNGYNFRDSEIHYDSKTYQLCDGDSVDVVFTGYHNIIEVTQTGYDNEDISTKIADIHGYELGTASAPLYKRISNLGAQPRTTRYFLCDLHPTKKFSVTCNAISIPYFNAFVECADGYDGNPQAQSCSQKDEPFVVSGCVTDMCVDPTTEGYVFNGGDLSIINFNPTIECAPGFEGTPTATPCSADGEAYEVSGCSPQICENLWNTTVTKEEHNIEVQPAFHILVDGVEKRYGKLGIFDSSGDLIFSQDNADFEATWANYGGTPGEPNKWYYKAVMYASGQLSLKYSPDCVEIIELSPTYTALTPNDSPYINARNGATITIELPKGYYGFNIPVIPDDLKLKTLFGTGAEAGDRVISLTLGKDATYYDINYTDANGDPQRYQSWDGQLANLELPTFDKITSYRNQNPKTLEIQGSIPPSVTYDIPTGYSGFGIAGFDNIQIADLFPGEWENGDRFICTSQAKDVQYYDISYTDAQGNPQRYQSWDGQLKFMRPTDGCTVKKQTAATLTLVL